MSIQNTFAEAAQYFPTPLQQFQFFDKTSRYDYTKGRRETWPETVDRAIAYLTELAPPMADWLSTTGRQMILTMQALPSMRLLAMAGPAARRQNLSIFNCSYLPVDDVEAFPEMLIISMSGCGVGFSVEQTSIAELPVIATQTGQIEPTHVVADSTEGWADALRAGVKAWWLDGSDIDFDFSQVREAGAILRVKGGRASGPEPLRELLATFKRILLARQGQRLTSLDCHDMACATGGAAVSGGIRRTAMISLYSKGDKLMRAAKTGDYPSIRWNANNSEVWRTDPSDDEIDAQMRAMFLGQNGEPGIFSGAAAARTMSARRREIWQSDLGVSVEESAGTNPCQPGFATVLTPDGIRTFADIDVGSTIWSGQRWTKVVRKVATGIKPVNCYITDRGHFIGTEDHRVVSRGVKVPVKDATVIDSAVLPPEFVGQRFGDLVGGARFKLSGWDESLASSIDQVIPLGEHPVYDITVEADEHTYWTGGLLVSNCGEIVLRPFGLCNLSIAVARADDTAETLADKVVAATVFGTIQATATNFPGLRPQWRRNAEAERLLGVDITGQMDCPLLTGPGAADLFAKLRVLAENVNSETATALGIAPAAAITTVKPAGNSAALLNCSSGVHGRHSAYYVRNARVSAHSPVYHVLRDAGAQLNPENGQTADNATTWVCAFPCRAPDGAVVKGDLTAKDQLDHWLLNKRYWTDHNPSCTITYRPDEEARIVQWVKEHRGEIGGLSFLPAFDANYEQMPYVEITEDEWRRRVETFPAIDWSRIALYEQQDTTTSSQEVVCTGDRCELR